MIIRRAVAADTAAVNDLLYRVLSLHAELRPDLFIAGTKKYTDEELAGIFAEETTPVFVAIDDGKLLGHCFCELQARKGANNMHDRTTLYIDDLCVDADAQGKGVAAALYRHVEDFARAQGCYNITLNVWTGNDRARHFYDKMGFGVQKTMMETIL